MTKKEIKNLAAAWLCAWMLPAHYILRGNFSVFFKKNINLPEGFTVTWHAGALHTANNTLPSLKTALDYGADIAELDVSFLPDGTPVLIHADAPTDTSLPKLEDAFALVAKYEKTCLNLDLKSVANVKAVDELAKKYGLENRAFYTGVGANWVPAVKSASALPYYLNAGPTLPEMYDREKAAAIVKKAVELGCIGLNMHFSHATHVIMEEARRQNMLVSLWTPSKSAEIKLVLAIAPDNLTTTRPDTAYRQLGRKLRKIR